MFCHNLQLAGRSQFWLTEVRSFKVFFQIFSSHLIFQTVGRALLRIWSVEYLFAFSCKWKYSCSCLLQTDKYLQLLLVVAVIYCYINKIIIIILQKFRRSCKSSWGWNAQLTELPLKRQSKAYKSKLISFNTCGAEALFISKWNHSTIKCCSKPWIGKYRIISRKPKLLNWPNFGFKSKGLAARLMAELWKLNKHISQAVSG